MNYSNLLNRFLTYVSIESTSDEESVTQPSAKCEWDMLYLLQKELNDLGASDIYLSEHGYLYATIPSNTAKELPSLGFVAHVDTAPAASGKGIKPVLHKNYDGSDIVLQGGTVLRVNEYPEMKNYIGNTVITADGTTLLGADDKAGVAEIMTLVEYLLTHPEVEHGKICIAFTPDEEVGRGTENFELKYFPADFGYTVDGGELGEIEYENFNAAALTLKVNGFSIHPGSAKNKMKNAITLAFEFHFMLPVHQDPVCTSGYEGFYMINDMQGSVEQATASYIIRDHDRKLFEQKKQTVLDIVQYLNKKYGEGTFEAQLRDSYYNMREVVEKHMHLVHNAQKAMEQAGVTPKIVPIRGGTDGASLSFKGLPCPNLCTGGHNFHGRLEFIPVESMNKTVDILLNIVRLYAE